MRRDEGEMVEQGGLAYFHWKGDGCTWEASHFGWISNEQDFESHRKRLRQIGRKSWLKSNSWKL